jgi:hypothetical protein
MIVRISALTAIAVLVASSASGGRLEAKSVHFSTCTQAGVEHGCIIARGDDGSIYNVTGTVQGLKANAWLQGTGVVSNRASYCMQGNTIANFVPDKDQNNKACTPASAH